MGESYTPSIIAISSKWDTFKIIKKYYLVWLKHDRNNVRIAFKKLGNHAVLHNNHLQFVNLRCPYRAGKK
jgi:hypothetical protein